MGAVKRAIADVFVRHPFNYDVVAAADECCVRDFGPSLTQQSQAEEADINVIVRRFGLTGQLPEGVRVPQYGDFTEVYDFKSAQDAIAMASSSFNAMPAEVRSRFKNDPQEFLEFCSKAENLDEMRKLGLAVPKPEVDTPVVPAGAGKERLDGGPKGKSDAGDGAGGGSGKGAVS